MPSQSPCNHPLKNFSKIIKKADKKLSSIKVSSSSRSLAILATLIKDPELIDLADPLLDDSAVEFADEDVQILAVDVFPGDAARVDQRRLAVSQFIGGICTQDLLGD